MDTPSKVLRYLGSMTDIEMLCEKKCQKRECYSVIHVPRLETHSLLQRQANQTTISLHSSKTPVVRTVSQPAINLITYLTNLFSTFGFWMGVSVLGTMKSLQQDTSRENSFWQILKGQASSLGLSLDLSTRFTDIPRKRRQQAMKSCVRSVRKVHPQQSRLQQGSY